MSNFERKLSNLSKLQDKINDETKVLGEVIEDHLGDGWYLTYDRGDGFLLLSPDSSNYKISTYLEAQNMPRDKAIEFIESHPCN